MYTLISRKAAAVILGVLAVVVVWGALPALAAQPYGVLNNVLCDEVTKNADGSYKTGKIITAFQKGGITFHSLTQVYFSRPGKYSLSFAIADPQGKNLANPITVNVTGNSSNFVHTQLLEWRVSFKTTGTHQFVIRVGNDVIGSYAVIVK